jgi:predicted amidohydrolase YtcJ
LLQQLVPFAEGAYLVPGFIDAHCHPDAIAVLAGLLKSASERSQFL